MPKAISKLKIPKHEPVWEGPQSNGPNGGISQSMLGAFLQCRERFRIKYVLGLKPAEQFNRALEYGNMWHLCEEEFAAGHQMDRIETTLRAHCQDLMKKYHTQQEEIDKWYNVCLKQFPIYIKHWEKHKDTQKRTGLLQEEVFHVPYALPSGGVVYLRGKFDGVDLIGKGKTAGIYLFETKTKGEIVEEDLKRQLNFDMQTMLYLVALQSMIDNEDPDTSVGQLPIFPRNKVAGVRYNVVRRPLSGGKGTIKQLEGSKNRAPETKEEYYTRLQQYFIEDPAYWFMRWTVEISHKDIENFKVKFLNPILEQLCDWWEHIQDNLADPFKVDTANDPENGRGLHWMHPWGAKNHLDERGISDYDEYIKSGNEVGLRRVKTLFSELQ